MKIFFYCMKPEPYIVSFLCERGHELSFRSENSKSLTENFESTLASIHVSDVAIFDVTQSDTNLGIAFTCAVLREKKKCIVVYDKTAENEVPEFIRGCTFKNVYIRPYGSIEEYMNILKVFLF